MDIHQFAELLKKFKGVIEIKELTTTMMVDDLIKVEIVVEAWIRPKDLYEYQQEQNELPLTKLPTQS